MVHPLGRLDEVLLRRVEDVGHVALRVPVDEGKPGALDLHHDPVALLEGVEHVLQRQSHRRRLAGHERFRVLVAVPEPPADHLAPHHHLVTAELHPLRRVLVVRLVVRVDVDELDDPVGGGPGGRDLEVGHEVAGQRHVLIQHVRLELDHVGAAAREPLVLVHVAAGCEHDADGIGVRNGLVRVADVLRVRGLGRGRRPGGQVASSAQVEPLRAGGRGRPRFELLPLVSTRVEDQRLERRGIPLPFQEVAEEGCLHLPLVPAGDILAEVEVADHVRRTGT